MFNSIGVKTLIILLAVLQGGSPVPMVRKCCPEGEGLAGNTSRVTCVPLEQVKALPMVLPNGSIASEGSYQVLPIPKPFCGGRKIKAMGFVDTVFTDGFVLWNGRERPYNCVDYLKEEIRTTIHQPTAVFCPMDPGPLNACPEGKKCVEKCCREGKVLRGNKSGRLRCEASNQSLWSPEAKTPQVFVRTSFFYLRRNLKLCYTSKAEYRIEPGGQLYSVESKTSTASYCIDNYIEGETNQVMEVILTPPENCHNNETEDPRILGLIFLVCMAISLFCLFLTFLTYWFVPSYHHLKGRIVLVNVVFTSLLSIFLIASYFTDPTSFHLDCADSSTVCSFIQDHTCIVLGYLFYFIIIGTFTWITIFGFNLYWSVHNLLIPDASNDKKFGFHIQLSLGPGLVFTILVLLLLQDYLSLPQDPVPQRAALAVLCSCIFWILLLILDLLWTFASPAAPTTNSDNATMRLSAAAGLGLPLLLTSLVATFHLVLPKDSLLNPLMGEQEGCILSGQSSAGRVLLLFHLPILSIILVNLLLFILIVREIICTRRNSNRDIKHMTQHMVSECVTSDSPPQVLYLKLFLVFGITWSIEVIGPICRVFGRNIYSGDLARGITSFASILNLLRGVFMFFVFVSFDKVRAHMRRWRRGEVVGREGSGRPQLRKQETVSSDIGRTRISLL